MSYQTCASVFHLNISKWCFTSFNHHPFLHPSQSAVQGPSPVTKARWAKTKKVMLNRILSTELKGCICWVLPDPSANSGSWRQRFRASTVCSLQGVRHPPSLIYSICICHVMHVHEKNRKRGSCVIKSVIHLKYSFVRNHICTVYCICIFKLATYG